MSMLSTSIKHLRRTFSSGSKSNNNGQQQRSSSSSPKISSSSSIKQNKKSQQIQIQSDDEMFIRLRREAEEVVKKEPILSMLLSKVGLVDASSLPNLGVYTAMEHKPASSFEEVISRIVAHRLVSCSGGTETICPKFVQHLIESSFNDDLELGHTMSEAVREDALAIVRRDPACETLLETVLFMKGFHSLVVHRAAKRAWKPASTDKAQAEEGIGVEQANPMDGNGSDENSNNISVEGSRFVALLLQSISSSGFGVDIHPAASIGAGVMIDHASGVVIGETATVGDGTTILHGVTLGGTGKDNGDRHPKIGRDVLIGAGTKILGNITVGDRAKIGAGSVVLRPIPSGATAVGAPAKIIGYVPKTEKPGSSNDVTLAGVEPLFGKGRGNLSSGSITEETIATTESGSSIATMDATTAEIVPAKEVRIAKDEVDAVVDAGGGSSADEAGIVGSNHHDKDDDEDDDNVTDFGTPVKCRWVNVPKHNPDGLCPFSGSFQNITSSLKQDTIAHAELRALLIQEGCSEGECVEVFFELLHCTPASSKARQCGCIPLDIFNKCFPEVAKEKTKLDEETIQALARGDLRTLGMSKKASRRFRSVFAVLGQKSAMALPSIPSSGSLGPLRKSQSLRKSEKESMTAHLDTTHYAEGITI